MGAGTFIAPKIIEKFGLRKTLFIAQFLNIVSTALKISFLYYPTILAGRIFFGIGVGICSFIFGKSLNETVPVHVQSKYGYMNNAILNVGFLVNGIFANIMLPAPDSDPQVLADDENWKLVYGFGIIF